MIKRPGSQSSRSHRRNLGQALVEFAIVAQIFFLVLFGIVEGGRFIFYYETLNDAARDAARFAIVNGANSLGCPVGPPAPGTYACDPTGEQVVGHVRDKAIGLDGDSIHVTVSWHDPANNGRGSTVTVIASYTYSTLVPMVPLPPITITTESSLVVNN